MPWIRTKHMIHSTDEHSVYGVVVESAYLSHVIEEFWLLTSRGVRHIGSPPADPRRRPRSGLERPSPHPGGRPCGAQRHAQHPGVAAAIAFAPDFPRLVRERQPDQRAPWWARAAASPLVPRQRCAQGRRDDQEAVRAGITRPWRTGPVVGQSNRVTRLKRQRVGRATFARLQPRVRRAASGPCSARVTPASRGSPRSAALACLQRR